MEISGRVAKRIHPREKFAAGFVDTRIHHLCLTLVCLIHEFSEDQVPAVERRSVSRMISSSCSQPSPAGGPGPFFLELCLSHDFARRSLKIHREFIATCHYVEHVPPHSTTRGMLS
jgi:hypothetical protein